MTDAVVGRQEWVAAIAEKAKLSTVEVGAVLARNGIAPKPSRAVPRRLTLVSLHFKGEKVGAKPPAEIDFQMGPMGPGLWAVLSGRNFRGKTTVLKIIRWCLTGRRHVPDEMKEWFREIVLVFRLDEGEYELRLDEARRSLGRLLKRTRGRDFVIASFEGAESFEAAMSAFFMNELGLEEIETHAQKSEIGVDAVHGWNWLSTAMFIDPNPQALFGSQFVGGMSARMMQMYLGFPWAATTAAIKAAQGRLNTERTRASAAATRMSATAGKRIAELEARRESLKAKSSGELSAEGLRKRMADAVSAFAEAEGRTRALAQMVTVAQDEFDGAQVAHTEARRGLQDHRESRAAGYVFRSIKPVCCPSCDEVFTEEREESHKTRHVCLVCATPETQGDDEEGAEARLVETVREAKAEVDRQGKRLAAAEREHEAAVKNQGSSERECQRAEAALKGASSSTDAMLDILRIDAQLEELRGFVGAEPAEENDEFAILAAAEKVTKTLYAEQQKAVLRKVSDTTLGYARAFGMETLDGVEIRGNTNMLLKKSGGDTSFGKCTEGERVRLKIAAALAIIKVAEGEGVGRHPGILLIDSPGVNEMVRPDYEALVSGLAGLAEEMENLQVIVAAVASDVILEHVPCTQVRQAVGDDYLW